MRNLFWTLIVAFSFPSLNNAFSSVITYCKSSYLIADLAKESKKAKVT